MAWGIPYNGHKNCWTIRFERRSYRGTPQGSRGILFQRKQVRAQEKALDFIEDEVGRPINYHSYVSGVAGQK